MEEENILEKIKNRENRKKLELTFSTIRCMTKLSKFLVDEIAHFDEVEDLTIDEHNWIYQEYNEEKKLFDQDLEENKDDEEFIFECRNVYKFKNLKELDFTSINLKTEDWIKFANNCTQIGQIGISDNGKSHSVISKEAISAILNIPTLKSFFLGYIFKEFPECENSNVEDLSFRLYMSPYITNADSLHNLSKLKNLKSVYFSDFNNILNRLTRPIEFHSSLKIFEVNDSTNYSLYPNIFEYFASTPSVQTIKFVGNINCCISCMDCGYKCKNEPWKYGTFPNIEEFEFRVEVETYFSEQRFEDFCSKCPNLKKKSYK